MFAKVLLSTVLLSFFLLFPVIICSETVSGVYTYQEKVGDTIIPFYWKVERSGGRVKVIVYEEEKSFINSCSENGATWEWRFVYKNKHDINAVRNGNVLTISGTKGGKKVERVIELDDRPWFQPLSYSLREFLDSSKKEVSFWTIRADTFEPIVLVARKKGIELVTFQEAEVSAQKIEVRAEGFSSHFWSGSYWFRKSDNIFLKYRSVHGFPGTTETVVTLLKTPGENG